MKAMTCVPDDRWTLRACNDVGCVGGLEFRLRRMTSRFEMVLSVLPGQGGGQWEWSDEGGVVCTSWAGGGLGIDVHLGSGGANSRM